MNSEFLKRFQAEMKPAFDASLDPVCIVNTSNQILFYNLAMKSFLGLRNRELGKKLVFCDLLKLSVCEPSCQVKHLLQTGMPIRIDESPAAKGRDKLRLSLRAVPILDPEAKLNTPPLGAVITLRDTTGEILLQAKYHKLLELMVEKDAKIADLDEKLQAMRTALRRARVDASS